MALLYIKNEKLLALLSILPDNAILPQTTNQPTDQANQTATIIIIMLAILVL